MTRRDSSHEDELERRVRLQKELWKECIKEGLKEWLDEKVLVFGWWSLTAIAGAGLVFFAWGILVSHGWELKK